MRSTRAAAAIAAVGLVVTTVPAATQDGARYPRTLAEYGAMFDEINNWGRWGADDERGTMNLITPAKTRAAAGLVRRGITVSLSHNPMPDEAPDNPDSAFDHVMGSSLRSDTYTFTYHGYGVSHLDSLCHFLWNDRMYNDIPPSASSPAGCGKLGIENLKSGIVTRGSCSISRGSRGCPFSSRGRRSMSRTSRRGSDRRA